MKKIIGYGLLLGLLVASLKFIQYSFIIHDFALEIYSGILAILFTVLGTWLGIKITRIKKVEVIKEIKVFQPRDFILDQERLRELGISNREYEILELMAQGLSNKEIAEKLFVSPNTIKTHSSRLFEKLDARRRTEAVKQAKSFGILP